MRRQSVARRASRSFSRGAKRERKRKACGSKTHATPTVSRVPSLGSGEPMECGASSPRAPASFVLGRHAPSWHRRTYRVARCVSSPRARGVSRTRSVAARARTRRASPAADRTSRRRHAALPPARPRGARPIAASPRRPHPWRSPREARGLPEVRSRCHRRLAAACGTVIRGTAGNGIRERS